MDNTKWYIGMTLRDIEKNVIEKVFKLQDGNITKVAAVLGVSPKTIYNKMKEYREEEKAKCEKS